MKIAISFYSTKQYAGINPHHEPFRFTEMRRKRKKIFADTPF